MAKMYSEFKTHPTITYSHTVGFLANQGRGFNNPVDVCLDNDGLLYVLNRAGPEVGIRLPYKRVTVCTKAGDYVEEFGTGGTAPGEFWWPSSIAMSPEGTIYTCLFSNAGTDLREPLRSGVGDEDIVRIINGVWGSREDSYSEDRAHLSVPVKDKVEMYHIGG